MPKIYHLKPARPARLDYVPLPQLSDNTLDHRLELHFPARPGPAFLQLLHATKSLGPALQWHWHQIGRFWYAARNEATRQFGLAILAQARACAGRIVGPPASPAQGSVFPEPADGTRESRAPVIHAANGHLRPEKNRTNAWPVRAERPLMNSKPSPHPQWDQHQTTTVA